MRQMDQSLADGRGRTLSPGPPPRWHVPCKLHEMQLPLQITFRGMDPSEAIESMIRERAARLERFHDRVVRCHVIVDVPHRHHRKGRLYAVRVDVTTPTGEIAATRDPSLDHSHQDFNVVVRDAFDAIARQLEDEVRDGAVATSRHTRSASAAASCPWVWVPCHAG